MLLGNINSSFRLRIFGVTILRVIYLMHFKDKLVTIEFVILKIVTPKLLGFSVFYFHAATKYKYKIQKEQTIFRKTQVCVGI